MIEMKESDYEKAIDEVLGSGVLDKAVRKKAREIAAARQASEPAVVDENEAAHAIVEVADDSVINIADEMHVAAHSLKHITRRDVDVWGHRLFELAQKPARGTDTIEFYCGSECVYSVESSMVPALGTFINIHKTNYKVEQVTFALDFSDMPFHERKMRCNIDLSKVITRKKAKP